MKLLLRRIGFAAAFSLPLGGCLDAVVHPLNFEPTAYEDSLCPKGPQGGGEIVNYGCAAGRTFAHHHYYRHHRRRIVRARY